MGRDSPGWKATLPNYEQRDTIHQRYAASDQERCAACGAAAWNNRPDPRCPEGHEGLVAGIVEPRLVLAVDEIVKIGDDFDHGWPFLAGDLIDEGHETGVSGRDVRENIKHECH